MPFENITLGNPYSKPSVNTLTGTTGYQLGKPTTKPLISPTGKPSTTTTAGGVTVNTIKPVIVQGEGKLPETEKEVDNKVGFWASKSKKQKNIIILGGIAVVSLIAFIALKKK